MQRGRVTSEAAFARREGVVFQVTVGSARMGAMNDATSQAANGVRDGVGEATMRDSAPTSGNESCSMTRTRWMSTSIKIPTGSETVAEGVQGVRCTNQRAEEALEASLPAWKLPRVSMTPGNPGRPSQLLGPAVFGPSLAASTSPHLVSRTRYEPPNSTSFALTGCVRLPPSGSNLP